MGRDLTPKVDWSKPLALLGKSSKLVCLGQWSRSLPHVVAQFIMEHSNIHSSSFSLHLFIQYIQPRIANL